MSAFTLVTHEPIPTKEGQPQKVRANPYIRLCKGDEIIFMQSGAFWYEDGSEVKDVPAWVAEEVAKCNPAVLAESGFTSVPLQSKPVEKKASSRKKSTSKSSGTAQILGSTSDAELADLIDSMDGDLDDEE